MRDTPRLEPMARVVQTFSVLKPLDLVCGSGAETVRVWKSSLGYSNADLKSECEAHSLSKGGGRFELVLKLVRAGYGAVEDRLLELEM